MALEWEVLGYAAGAEAIRLLFLTLPDLDWLRCGLAIAISPPSLIPTVRSTLPDPPLAFSTSRFLDQSLLRFTSFVRRSMNWRRRSVAWLRVVIVSAFDSPPHLIRRRMPPPLLTLRRTPPPPPPSSLPSPRSTRRCVDFQPFAPRSLPVPPDLRPIQPIPCRSRHCSEPIRSPHLSPSRTPLSPPLLTPSLVFESGSDPFYDRISSTHLSHLVVPIHNPYVASPHPFDPLDGFPHSSDPFPGASPHEIQRKFKNWSGVAANQPQSHPQTQIPAHAHHLFD